MSDSSQTSFSLGNLFSQAFMPHNEDDIERYLTVGSLETTPAIQEVSAGCPTPWAFVRILGGSLLAYFILLFTWSKFQNINILPGIIFTGTVMVPLSVLMLFFELNVRKNISMYVTLKMVLLGGALSLLYVHLLILLSGWFNFNLDKFGDSSAAFVEEPAKLLVLFLLVNRKRYTYILNGLLLGAAVGTGFAVYESSGYALFTMLKAMAEHGMEFDKAMINTIIIRGFLSPFGHIIWTALVGGALWMVKENRNFRIGMLFDIRFLVFLLISIGLHFAWNSDWDFKVVTTNDKYLLLGVIGWALVFWMVKAGLRQIAAEGGRLADQDGAGVPNAGFPRTGAGAPAARAVGEQTATQEDPLGIQGRIDQSIIDEKNRRPADHAGKGWTKYYHK